MILCSIKPRCVQFVQLCTSVHCALVLVASPGGTGALLHGCPELLLHFRMGHKDLVFSSEWGFEVVTGFLYDKLAKHFGFITLLLAVMDILISIFIV